MKIIFTKHATDKLRTKEAKRFKITKAKVIDVLSRPIFEASLPGAMRAVGELDTEHALCIVYKFEDDIIKVITFFPSEKGRYEN